MSEPQPETYKQSHESTYLVSQLEGGPPDWESCHHCSCTTVPIIRELESENKQLRAELEEAKKFNLFCLDKGITLLEIGQQNRMTFNAGEFIDARIEFEKAITRHAQHKEGE